MNKKIHGAKFHHIALASHCYEKTLEFYKVLGMEQVAEWDSGDGKVAMMQIGNGGIFEIFARGKDVSEQDAKFFHLAIETDDPDGAYELALQAGARSKLPPKDVVIPSRPAEMHVRIAFVYGPNGEELEFFHHKR